MIKELQDIGFSEKEAKIYILLAQQRELSAPKIAFFLNIDRRTVYDLLNSLFQKGWISRKRVQNREVFSIINASIIAEEFNEKLKNFEKIIPELKIKEKTDYPQINVLYGLKAIQTIVNQALKCKGEILLMGRGGYLIKQLGESKYQYISKLNKLNWKMIQTEDYKNKEFKPKEIRYLPKRIKFDTAFLTFSDKVYLFSKYEEIFLIEIINKAFAETFKEYFKLLWKIAKK